MSVDAAGDVAAERWTREPDPVPEVVSPPADRPGPDGLVDYRRTGRRVRASAVVLGSCAVAGWVVTSLVGDGFDGRALGNWVGLALAVMFAVEVVVVGGSALRGMLRAGERGERLAGNDVGLLPTPLRRRLRRRR